MTSVSLPWVTSDEIFARIESGAAVRAVQHVLKAGLDPAEDFDRVIVNVENGQLLYMPSQSSTFIGAKFSTVAPNNPTLGKERIQGIYVLMDSATLAPIMLMDGRALTALRTPAVSVAIADYLAPRKVDHLLVFGSGTQAWQHIKSMRTIRSINRVTIVARNQDRSNALVARVVATGLPAHVGKSVDVSDADVIICATTSQSPLFDGKLVLENSLTLAVGSHRPDEREFDSMLAERAQLVVEDRAVAMREAGDIVIPFSEGLIDPASLVPMRDIITGKTRVDHDRPRVFKSTGMGWEDLVIAVEIFRRLSISDPPLPSVDITQLAFG